MEEIIYSALLALGFNPSHLSSKERISLDENIFKRMNQKDGDYILFFLFSNINYQQAVEVFRDCWPIHDKKIESQFRNAAFDWFKKLNQSEEFNIKPNLVVSKAVVTPTSNKFIGTVYTLCRFALHSQIMKKDSSYSILLLPAGYKPEQFQNVLQVIRTSKLYHKNRYIKAVNEREKMLKLLQNTARKIVEKYRATVKSKISLQEDVEQGLRNSSFLNPAKREILTSCPLNRFEEEISESIKDKNEEIRLLWMTASTLEREHQKSWINFSNIIRGEKCLPYINGEDYVALNHKTSQDFPFIKYPNNELFHKEGKLDVVSVFQTANLALKSLMSFSQEFHHITSDVKKQSKESENQLNCVLVLKKETKEVQTLLNNCYPALVQSVIELRKDLEDKTDLSLQDKTGSFHLCPPTPFFNIVKYSPPRRSLQSKYQLFKLTPSEEISEIINGDRITGTPISHITRSLRKSRLPKRRIGSELASPQLKNLVPLSDVNCSGAADSGCAMSDTLLQSLERLNVTPKRKLHLSTHRNSLHLNSSHLVNRSVTDCVNRSEIQNSVFNQSDITNRTLNISNISSSYYKRVHENHLKENGYFSEESYGNNNELYQDEVSLQSKFHLSEKEKCRGINNDMNVSNTFNKHIPKFKIRQSPIISNLLKELETDNETTQPEKKFQAFARRWKNMKQNLSTSREVLNSSYSNTTYEETSSRKNKSFLPAAAKETLENSHSRPSDSKDLVQKTFYSCVSSLESWLSDGKDTADLYQFKTDNVLSKIPLEKDEAEAEDSESFSDSICILEKDDFFSNINRRDSIFQTVAESAISGELEPDIILSDQIGEQVRRESIAISRRESMHQMRLRTGGGEIPTLSTFVSRLSMEGGNIFDESDSCLLSTSSDAL